MQTHSILKTTVWVKNYYLLIFSFSQSRKLSSLPSSTRAQGFSIVPGKGLSVPQVQKKQTNNNNKKPQRKAPAEFRFKSKSFYGGLCVRKGSWKWQKLCKLWGRFQRPQGSQWTGSLVQLEKRGVCNTTGPLSQSPLLLAHLSSQGNPFQVTLGNNYTSVLPLQNMGHHFPSSYNIFLINF